MSGLPHKSFLLRLCKLFISARFLLYLLVLFMAIGCLRTDETSEVSNNSVRTFHSSIPLANSPEIKQPSDNNASGSSWPEGSTWGSRFANGMNQCRSPYPGPTTGTLAWRRLFYNNISTWPVITAAGQVIVGTEANRICCFNPDATLAWEYHVDNNYSEIKDIQIGPDSRIYALDTNQLTVLNSNGQFEWSRSNSMLGYYGISFTYLSLVKTSRVVVFYMIHHYCTTFSYGTAVFSPSGELLYQIGTLAIDTPAYHVDDYIIFTYRSHLLAMTLEGINVWGRHDHRYFPLSVTQSTGTTYTPFADNSYNQASNCMIEATDGGGNPLFYQVDSI